jgi:S1-C subfamily serine protease
LTGLLRKWLASLEAQASNGPISQLGMTLLDPRISLMKRRAVGLPDVQGFLVHAVEPGSWSDNAGFRKGDLICKIEGRGVSTPAQLRKVLNAPRPRIKRFSILRGSESLDL